MSEGTIIGIDIGGTKTAAGLVSFPGGGRSEARVVPTHAERGGRAVLGSVTKVARDLASEAQARNMKVSGLGLGICELVSRAGEISSANCIRWLGLPVHTELASIGPVVVEADVRAAAVAEAWTGGGRAYDIFLYVTVGTGISTCLVVHKQPYLGARGFTGTIASAPVSLPCPACRHKSNVTLEDFASGPALARRFREGGGLAETAKDVLAAAEANDTDAQAVVTSGAEALGATVGLLVNTLDPEAVVIGGGLGTAEGMFWDTLVRSTREHIWSPMHRDLPLLRAQNGVDAGWVGAAICAATKFRLNNSTQPYELFSPAKPS